MNQFTVVVLRCMTYLIQVWSKEKTHGLRQVVGMDDHKMTIKMMTNRH